MAKKSNWKLKGKPRVPIRLLRKSTDVGLDINQLCDLVKNLVTSLSLGFLIFKVRDWNPCLSFLL